MPDAIFEIGQIFLISCSSFATITGFIYRNRSIELKLLYLYPAASLIETIVTPMIKAKYPNLEAIGIPEMLVNIFLVLEFFIIYNFFFRVFESYKIRRMLYLSILIYSPLVISVWYFKRSFNTQPHLLFIPQAIFILVPTFYYFFHLLKKPGILDLKHEPSFWIATGLMLYFGCTLPLFLSTGILDYSNSFQHSTFTINYICYGLLFLLLVKAYLCKMRKPL